MTASMDELKFFAGLTAITLTVIGLFIYFGLKLNKAVGKHAPEINFPLNITWSGNILFAAIAGAVLEKFGYPIARKGNHS